MRIDDFKYRFTDQPGGWWAAPMQKGASFNLAAVKQQIDKAIQSPAGK